MSEPKQEYRIEGRPATIFRTVKNKDNPYVMIDRRPIDNPALSFKAKGILTYLMSRPDGWEVSVTDLVKHGEDGENSVRSGLKELRKVGHMRYTVSRNQGRITGWLIEVFEVPDVMLAEVSPDRDFQDVDNPDVDNRGQVLMTLSNTDSNQDDDESSQKPKTNPEPERPIKRPSIFTMYEKGLGTMIVQAQIPDLLETEKEYPADWIEKAFKIAADNNARKWSYVKAVLENMKAHGRDWKPAKYKSKANPTDDNRKSLLPL